MEAYISKGKSAVKLEYHENGAKITKLWEQRGDHTLETTFNGDGAILVQELTKLDHKDVLQRVDIILKNAGIISAKEVQYEDVKLNKQCPKCSASGLSRHVEAFSTRQEIPVMPLYHCKGCGSQSYYLTDSYLEHLVVNNKGMFDVKELSELDANKQAFMDELKAYIIRIFASKRIMCIK
ncbi:MAG: hypothetical protein KGH60_02355 [Candidatus Micrarchaeota archaeon]|nr:hypothetical protein [Candidatus Micrarchaeota archaeon]